MSKDFSVDDLRSQLPDLQPRFILISYKVQHSDGRLSFPLCLAFSSPQGIHLTFGFSTFVAGHTILLICKYTQNLIFCYRLQPGSSNDVRW